MAKTNIFVPQTGTIYPSLSAAASALGVDASNIGKVIRGSRKSAGGYNFVPVDPGIAPATLRDITEALDTSLSERQRARQEKSRKAGFKRLSKEEQAAAKARARATSKAAKELSRSLVEANKLMKEYQKRGLDAISGVIPELEALKSIIGKNKRGGFQASQKELQKFSKEQLEALKRRIDQQLNRKSFKDIESAEKKKAAVAYQLGISSEELDAYSDILPTLWQVLHLAGSMGVGYDPMYQDVLDAFQASVDPEEMRDILEEIKKEHEDLIESFEDQEEPEDREALTQDDYDRMMKKYLDKIEEKTQVQIQSDEEEGDDWLDGWTTIL